MEQLREKLLKNGWLRAVSVPLLTHGERAAPPSTSNLDKWLDDFESKMLNPVSGFEENKDANPDFIQEILTMMSSEKRIPQIDKVLVDATNVRENLLKRGWYAFPLERRDAFVASILSENQRKAEKTDMGMNGNYMENIQLQEPKDDIEKLLNMLASKKEATKAGKCRGSVDKVNIREALLKLGWRMKNDEPAASSGVFAAETPVSDNMTDLEKWFQQFEDQRNQNIQTKATEDHITFNKDVEKILDMLSSKTFPPKAKPSQEADSESSAPKPKDVNTTDVASALEGCTQKTVTTNKDAIGENTRGHIVKTKSTGTKEKSSKKTIRHGTDINSLVQQGWSVTKKSRHQITMVKDDASAAPKRGSMKIQAKGRQSRKDKFEAQNKNKTTSRPKTTSLGKGELTGNDCEALASAPGVSHKKKTLFRRFLRRSGKLMGRFFTCGRNED